MSQTNKDDFDIVALIELCRANKYESCVAGFAVIDKIEKIPIPKKMKSRKLTVQALYALTNNLVQWKYMSVAEREKIQEEKDKISGLSSTSGTSFAPHAEEDTDEDFIPEEEAKKPEALDDEFGDGTDDFDDDDDEDEKEEEDEEEEEETAVADDDDEEKES